MGKCSGVLIWIWRFWVWEGASVIRAWRFGILAARTAHTGVGIWNGSCSGGMVDFACVRYREDESRPPGCRRRLEPPGFELEVTVAATGGWGSVGRLQYPFSRPVVQFHVSNGRCGGGICDFAVGNGGMG